MKKKTKQPAWISRFQQLSESKRGRKATTKLVRKNKAAARAKVQKALSTSFKQTTRKKQLTKTVRVIQDYRARGKKDPVLTQANFKKMLKANIEKAINTGDFASAKKYIPVYQKALAGRLSKKKQIDYENRGYVGNYTVASGGGRGFTIKKVYSKNRLSKIIPNEILDDKTFKILAKDLGYSRRAIDILRGRQTHAKIPTFGRSDLNSTLKRAASRSGSWSGSSEFDQTIENMGGFLIAIAKYPKEVSDLASRYGVPIDDLILKYAPEFVD